MKYCLTNYSSCRFLNLNNFSNLNYNCSKISKNNFKKHSVIRNCSDLSLFEQNKIPFDRIVQPFKLNSDFKTESAPFFHFPITYEGCFSGPQGSDSKMDGRIVFRNCQCLDFFSFFCAKTRPILQAYRIVMLQMEIIWFSFDAVVLHSRRDIVFCFPCHSHSGL